MNKNEVFTKLKVVFKAIILELAIIFGGLILDLTSKAIVQATMNEGDSVTLIPKFLNIFYTKNKNAAFGSNFGLGKLFGEKGVLIFFIVLTVFAVGFFAYLLFKRPQKGILYRIAFSLIISGAIGNLVDRVFFGYVRDFIQFEYFGLTIFGSTSFAVFNIADSCVVVGAILLIVYFLFFDRSLFGKVAPIEASDDDKEGGSDIIPAPEEGNDISPILSTAEQPDDIDNPPSNIAETAPQCSDTGDTNETAFQPSNIAENTSRPNEKDKNSGNG